MRVHLGLILLASALALGSHAQVYRCTDAKGRTTYTDEPCAGSKSLNPALLKGNTTQSLIRPAEPTPGANRASIAVTPNTVTAPSQERQAPNGACPTSQDVSNIETAATSIRLRDQWEELRFLREEVQRARACSIQMRYTIQDWKDLETYRQYQHRLDPRDRAEARRAAQAIHLRARANAN